MILFKTKKYKYFLNVPWVWNGIHKKSGFIIYRVCKDDSTHHMFVYMCLLLSNVYNMYIKIRSKIRCKIASSRNKTAKEALYMMDRWDNTGTYVCPECNETYYNDKLFEDHIVDDHGYPIDFDILRFYNTGTTIQNGKIKNDYSKKYLKYL